METKNYEKLGVFYLGRRVDTPDGDPLPEPILYDAKDLTTHGLCVGMTGSGKTGLCLDLLEEAAMDGIPALAIDPKGDLGNLMLTFPDLKPENFAPWIDEGEARRKGKTPEAYAKDVAAQWKDGLAEWDQDGDRIARLRNNAEVSIYTPGGTAGIPLTILRSFQAPPEVVRNDPEALGDRIAAAVSGLLALLRIDADPIRSREHILLSAILNSAWSAGKNLDLPALINAVQKPPFDKVGVFDLESFYPLKERFELALALNGVVASPGFQTWTEGEPLDIDKLLYTPEGKPRIAILSIAHLSEQERMFFVTILLNEVLSWIRTQPGTSSLRALLYMDEIFGYFPPSAEPPSKRPMLTLLKQARAYGLGVMLATQNPVDLDYKGLSNTGTWFLGRLQTERDKMRVLDGLESASAAQGAGFNRADMEAILSGLGKRTFLLHNVHEDAPVIFRTRWAMSYLRGPLTRKHIETLSAPAKAARAAQQTKTATTNESKPSTKTKAPEPARPVLPPAIEEAFLEIKQRPGNNERLLYRPALLARTKLRYAETKVKVDDWESTTFLAPVPKKGEPNWGTAQEWPNDQFESDTEPFSDDVAYAELPASALNAKHYTQWEKELKSWIYTNRWAPTFRCMNPKLYGRFREEEGAFRGRLAHLAREDRDAAMEKLRASYGTKLQRLQERIRKAEQRVEREEAQYKNAKMSTVISVGTTLIGALFGRKSSSVGKAATAMRGAGRAAGQKGDIDRAEEDVKKYQIQLEDMERDLEIAIEEMEDTFDPASLDIESIDVRPRKTDITVLDFSLAWVPWAIDADGIARNLAE